MDYMRLPIPPATLKKSQAVTPGSLPYCLYIFYSKNVLFGTSINLGLRSDVLSYLSNIMVNIANIAIQRHSTHKYTSNLQLGFIFFIYQAPILGLHLTTFD